MKVRKYKLAVMTICNLASFFVSLIQGNTIGVSLLYSILLGGYYTIYIFLVKSIPLGIGVFLLFHLISILGDKLDNEGVNYETSTRIQ